ncbi:ubiquitin carboxyl-terminal hydrolase 47-like [Mugil cephalus]|uniref:ubiquitin carboxyl-terminal hydrolase 47-like n=1 Tax=Mugil cephalus TaxID=48193 RepID=UPI001FB67FF4|nr:ubiquitin carboxyl-terminal hydrolase 47-like [Mugil cephalus]
MNYSQGGSNSMYRHSKQDNKLRRKRNDEVQYHGLMNQGSTCYLNSVLQVLFMTKDFREAVKRKNDESTEFINRHLQKLFEVLEQRTADTDEVRLKLGIYRVYEQQDAAVYFEKILRLTDPEASKIFNGKLAYKTNCAGCDNSTERDGPFWHLPLALVDSGRKTYSVVDGIKDYFKASCLSKENQLYCDACEDKKDATTTPVIKHHPDVLVLLLKRFKYDTYYKSYLKINCAVDVPYSLQIPENQTYELYAVVDHVGDLRSGHYTATIKEDHGDSWYEFNDSWVSLCYKQPFKRDTIERSQRAYLLFYRKEKNADAQNSQEVHPSEVQATISDNNDQDEDAETIRDRDKSNDAAEDGNTTGASVSIDRAEETEQNRAVPKGASSQGYRDVEGPGNDVSERQTDGPQECNAGNYDHYNKTDDKQVRNKGKKDQTESRDDEMTYLQINPMDNNGSDRNTQTSEVCGSKTCCC